MGGSYRFATDLVGLAVDFAADFEAPAGDLAADDLAADDFARRAAFSASSRAAVDIVGTRDLRPRARKGRFQFSPRSARKVSGISGIASPSSRTERAAISAMSARTSAMTYDGRRALAACTRFVR